MRKERKKKKEGLGKARIRKTYGEVGQLSGIFRDFLQNLKRFLAK